MRKPNRKKKIRGSSTPSGEPTPRKRGRPPKLGPAEIEILGAIARERPTATLDEMAHLLAARTGVKVSDVTLRRGLAAAGIERVKPVTPRARADSGTSESPTEGRYGYLPMHRDEGDDVRYPSSLTDAEWDLVKDIFDPTGPGRPPEIETRVILDACCYVVRSGCSWRMLPKEFPAWTTVYKRFQRWAKQGRFERMHDRLRDMWRQQEGRNPQPTGAIIDSQSVRTSPQGGEKGYDAGKKIKGRKRHLLVDTLGLLLAVSILPADIQDRDAAGQVVDQGLSKYPGIQKLWADGGYGGRRAQEIRDEHGIDVEIVRHPANRTVGRLSNGQIELFEPPSGFVVLPRRWVVERTNAWNSRPRRMARDNDRQSLISTAWVWLIEARILGRRLSQGAA